MKKLLILITSLAITGLFGCGEDAVDTEPVNAVTQNDRPVDLGAAPDRARRRMDIDQLRASVVRVTDGVDWMSGDTNQFERFDDTLGVPNYISSTSEDTAVSVLFVKFLDDMSRAVCRQLIARETGEEARGVFFRFDVNAETPPTAAEVDETLAYLLLRYHGRRLDSSSPELQSWRDLIARLSTSMDADGNAPNTAQVYESVCVALIDHPDFYTY